MKEDMELAGVTVEEAMEGPRWRQMIGCGDPRREQPEEEEDAESIFKSHSSEETLRETLNPEHCS